MSNESIFAIVRAGNTNLSDIKFFKTKESAQQCLKEMAKERKFKFGVHDLEESENEFSYILGAWEEIYVKFYIKEIALEK